MNHQRTAPDSRTPATDADDVVDADEAADLLGIKRASFLAAVRRGAAPAGQELDGAHRWTRDEVEQYKATRHGIGRPKGATDRAPRNGKIAQVTRQLGDRLAAGETLTGEQVAREYDISRASGHRALTAARRSAGD